MVRSHAHRYFRGIFLLWVVGVLSVGCRTVPVRMPPPSKPFIKRSIKPAVAVTSFENRSGFEGEWRIGQGMADLLVAELSRCQRFEVLERQHLNDVLTELGYQRSPLFRQEGKARLGQLKHGRYLIRGVIHDFSHTSGIGFWAAMKRIFLRGRVSEARVTLTLTVVDVESGSVVGTASAAGYAHSTEGEFRTQYKNVAFGGEAFYRTPLGTATREAIRSSVRHLIRVIPREYWQPMIAEVREDGVIVLNGGSDCGFEIGRVYQVRKAPSPVTCPVTGDVLEWLPGPVVGRIRVIRFESRLALAAPEGQGTFERGQLLEPVRGEPGEPLP